MTTEFKDILSFTGGAIFSGAVSAISNATYGHPQIWSATNVGVGSYSLSGTESTAANIALAVATLITELKAKKIIN
jgi:hypothetical protein